MPCTTANTPNPGRLLPVDSERRAGQPDRMAARLVYVMGPSGAGKDAVLERVRRDLDGRIPVVFAHRYTTREPGFGHPNEVALGPGEYALRRARGLFAFSWDAWSVRYAVGSEIREWLARDLTVVVSGSREHFMREPPCVSALLPVLITAAFAERARRLRARAREPEAAILERLRRGDAFHPTHPDLVTITNDGPLEQAAAAFAALLAAG